MSQEELLNEIRNKLCVYSLSSSLGLIEDIPASPLYQMAGKLTTMTAAGKAFTVKAYDGIGYNAFQDSGEGDFVVVAAQGNRRIVWGGIGSRMVQNKGGCGALVDGGVIGIDAAKEVKVPTFYRYSSSATANHVVDNEIGCEVEVARDLDGARLQICHGDIIAADYEGLVVIKPENLAAVVARGRYVEIIARYVWGVHGGAEDFADLSSIPGYSEFWDEKGSLPDDQESLAYVHYYEHLMANSETRPTVEGLAKETFPDVAELFQC